MVPQVFADAGLRAASLDPRAPRRRAEQIRRSGLVNCRSSSAVGSVQLKGSDIPARIDTCCFPAPNRERRSCSCSSSARLRLCWQELPHGARFHRPSPIARFQPRPSATAPCRGSARAAPRRSSRLPFLPRLQPPARSRLHAERVLSNFGANRCQCPGQPAGRMPVASGLLAGGALLEGLAGAGEFYRWRGVGRCCSGSWGGGRGSPGRPRR